MAFVRKYLNERLPVLDDQLPITAVYGTNSYNDQTIIDVPSMVFRGVYSWPLRKKVLAVRAQVKNIKGSGETALILDRTPHPEGVKRQAVVSGAGYDYAAARRVQNLFSGTVEGSRRLERLRYIEREATKLKTILTVGAAACLSTLLIHSGDGQPTPQPEERDIVGSIAQFDSSVQSRDMQLLTEEAVGGQYNQPESQPGLALLDQN